LSINPTDEIAKAKLPARHPDEVAYNGFEMRFNNLAKLASSSPEGVAL
jgi:hypothetical protein